MTAYADFGGAIAPTDIDKWVMNTIEYWIDTYLTWIEAGRPQNDGTLLTEPLSYKVARPLAYANVVEDGTWTSSALPCILVATAKTDTAALVVNDGGKYSVPWVVAVSALVRGQNNGETRDNASLTELAYRMALVQHPTLGGFARSTRWISGGQARPLNDPTGEGRYLGEGASTFRVWTDDAVQGGVGPTTPDLNEPPPSPYENLPLVQSISFGVDGDTTVVNQSTEDQQRVERDPNERSN